VANGRGPSKSDEKCQRTGGQEIWNTSPRLRLGLEQRLRLSGKPYAFDLLQNAVTRGIWGLSQGHA
jgi:hypothetical protein